MKKIILTDAQVKFLDDLLDVDWVNEFEDGAWGAICQELIAGSDEFKNMNPFDVWMEWCHRKAGIKT